MIFVTGDCHTEFNKLSTSAFPEQKEMTKNDIVIICGDFGGIWDQEKSSFEQYWLKWLDDKPFTTVFADGNHENFDRLNSEFEVVDFHGGKAHRISESVYHLMRGEIFDFEGKKFFFFGGASSHDIKDGILSRKDFRTDDEFKNTIKMMRKRKKEFRVEHISWWKEELPSDEEIANAEKNLSAVENSVDIVITHCAPQSVADKLFAKPVPSDRLTLYFDELAERISFKYWFFGHYHDDKKVNNRFILLYDQIVRIQ